MSEQEADRSEVATPFKLQKAREKGQAARSTDLVAAAVFGVAMAFLAWQGWTLTVELLRVARSVLAALTTWRAETGTLWPLVAHLVRDTLFALLPFLLLLMATAVAATLAQTGFILALEPLKPDFNRINPVAGLKRLLSLRTLFDAARAIVKVCVLVLAAWLALEAIAPRMPQVAGLAPWAFLRALLADTADLGLKMALALALIACVDVAFTRHEFARQMRMSRRELKDEHKNREGDPRIRGRLRELRREALKRSQALRHTRDADVVLTNPTHYAVALRYVHGEMDVPRLAAKGAGQLAGAMRELAWRHRIAVVRHPALARRLFRELAIDDPLPPAFHAEVARILVWVFTMREQRRNAGGAP